MTKTLAELVDMTDEEIIAYLESGEGFVDNPAPFDKEQSERIWIAICKKLDLKPEPMNTDKSMNKAWWLGFIAGAITVIFLEICFLVAKIIL